MRKAHHDFDYSRQTVDMQIRITIDNLATMSTNVKASQSRIQDADYAKETTELARTQIIQQAATAMLAQANQQAKVVMDILNWDK